MPGSLFAEPERTETLEGALERITFTNQENAWSVVKLAVPGRRELVTAVGNLLGIQPGENLRLTGRWVKDRKYGEQFKVESYMTVNPSTVTGLRRYLGSGLVPGVGPVMAERLVERFGIETLDVIENAPERLAEVEGIGPVRSERIRAAWRDQRGVKEVMIFLQSLGISNAWAIRIFKQYRDRAIAVVREDPYRLATDVFGIGFRTADGIASSLGIPKDAPRRIEAGVMHVLGQIADEGHVFAPRARLVSEAATALDVDVALVETAIGSLATAGGIVIESGSLAAAGGDGGEKEDDAGAAVFLRALHVAETGTASCLLTLARTPARPIAIDPAKAIAWFESTAGIALAPQQAEAIRRAFSSKVLVVTGGPGTGKTTLVNGIIRILEKKGRRILLAAPTGRAAKRMEEATGRPAKTIHRLLEFNPRPATAKRPDQPERASSAGFQRDAARRLETDLLVVDEASMLDIVLAHHLLRAVPDAAQIILVGDVDQIPSVGPGRVLADLIDSGVIEVVRLTEIFRQERASRIVESAHRVNRGEMPLVESGREEGDFFFFARSEPEEVLATLKTLVSERIPRKFGFDPMEDIQVLTPMHRGLIGASNLNTELQALLNPNGAALERGNRRFRVGDKVMQVRNNYDLEVFNGDIGRVDAIDPTDRRMNVRYEDRVVAYDADDLDELVLAYACSIHKAQGSEYPCVVIPLHTQHYIMLRRNLLYTALTRAKRLLVVVGSKRALAIAVGNARVETRATRLAERLRNSMPAGTP